jgi:hypothetical protein
MNVDLTNNFKEARKLLTTWKKRYTAEEYPYKVVLNVFYRKFTIEKMWPRVINQSQPTWEVALHNNVTTYSTTAQFEIVPILENLVKSNRQVGSIKFSDFQSYINAASKGDPEALKGIEYTYLLHRILDDLVILWISFVNAGTSKIDAIARLTGALIADMPIDSYRQIEQIFDQLGAEKHLQMLLLKEMAGHV